MDPEVSIENLEFHLWYKAYVPVTGWEIVLGQCTAWHGMFQSFALGLTIGSSTNLEMRKTLTRESTKWTSGGLRRASMWAISTSPRTIGGCAGTIPQPMVTSLSHSFDSRNGTIALGAA